MSTNDYLGREPDGNPYDLLTSLAPMLVVLALVALIVGFGLGQTIQSQFADIAARNEMLARAVDQFDEAVASAEDLAASAQKNIVAVFGANGVSPEGPVPPDKKAEGDKDKTKGISDNPQPAPLPAESGLKGVDQLRAANDDVTRIRESLNFAVEVPEETPTGFSFFGEANAKHRSHTIPVPAPKAEAKSASFGYPQLK